METRITEDLDEGGLSWKRRAELAEETIRDALRAGRLGAFGVLDDHAARLAHLHRLVAAQPYMREAQERIEADLRASGGATYEITEIVDLAERIARERRASPAVAAAPAP